MKNKFWISLISLLFLGCGEFPVDWTPTFDSTDTVPFGTYVLREELQNIFPDSKIENIQQKTGEFFDQNQYRIKNHHYILIYPANILKDSTWLNILDFVYQGGSALISESEEIPVLEEYLAIKTTHRPNAKKDSNFRMAVSDKKFDFDKISGTTYFSEFNPDFTDVLGYIEKEGEMQPNFIKVYYGNGYFLLHTEPFAFTNYQMLHKNHSQYVAEIFSYMENEDILWDNYRIFRRQNSEPKDGGFFDALSFILKNKPLRWAFFLLLFFGFLFLIFNSKRKQKAVKVIMPYSNYSLEFAKTLSEVYRYNSDHTAMVKYKINFFLDQMKTHYNITSKTSEKEFPEILSAKSNVPVELCEKLVLTIDIFRNKNYLDKEDFYKLQTLIESFNKKSNLYGTKSK